ncbi:MULTISPECIES: response regulator [Geobacter]|uniref:response regulator n=1 Tax=Geobacter TaxID=28231 RepID=UPI002573BA9F|nr:response regulator [Geobacter sulfurreducens]BEH10886.1 response regulator [Geobacter sulfurreducens subsp. ethanolicus]BET58729.1 response regulator [Geobacter sp. 60473]HML79743.1 response regulator [Geobacter sulfurreducens]
MDAGRRTILIIDDDAFFLKVLSDAFTESGFRVVQASNGTEGVQAFITHRPDAVISDLIMPAMGGVSTCLEIRRLAGNEEPVMVLLTSMFKDAPHEHDEPEMGARVHVSKSTNPVDIVIIVEQLLDRKIHGRSGN